MADLSPAAQAVLDGYNAAPPDHSIHELPPDCGHRALAAALRALADQVVPKSELPQRESFSDRSVWQWAVDCHNHDADTRSKLLAIAAELEA